jgi:hypothetical protein
MKASLLTLASSDRPSVVSSSAHTRHLSFHSKKEKAAGHVLFLAVPSERQPVNSARGLRLLPPTPSPLWALQKKRAWPVS